MLPVVNLKWNEERDGEEKRQNNYIVMFAFHLGCYYFDYLVWKQTIKIITLSQF